MVTDDGVAVPKLTLAMQRAVTDKADPRHEAVVLFYLYNKAPRGASAHRRYEQLRARLARLAGDRAVVVGRLPSDALLPRAWHEVLAVLPTDRAPALAGRAGPVTEELAAALAREGAVES